MATVGLYTILFSGNAVRDSQPDGGVCSGGLQHHQETGLLSSAGETMAVTVPCP